MEKLIEGYPYVLYDRQPKDDAEMLDTSRRFYEWMDQRRTVREFSAETFPVTILENAIRAASTAPSGAHKQPWTFCVVSNAQLKRQIREAAEKEEYESYHGRMSEEWLRDLAPLGTDWNKPFLETAPYLIVVFKRVYETEESGHKHQNYYVSESVGLACGFLLAALHEAGLVALTHTPSPMNFLGRLLERPENERPYLLIPVGKPMPAYVPKLERKPLEEVCFHYV